VPTIERATEIVEYTAQLGQPVSDLTDQFTTLAEHVESCSAMARSELTEVRETLYSWINLIRG